MKLRTISVGSLALLYAVLVISAYGIALPQAADHDADSDNWGGNHVAMIMNAQGATLEFDCAHGAISQPIKPNASGQFSVSGTFTPEHGGPIQRSNPPRDLPAVYKGSIHGDTMHLEIILGDKSPAPDPLVLTKGNAARLMKCR